MMKEPSINVLESLPAEIPEMKVSSLENKFTFVGYKKEAATIKGRVEPYLFLLPAIVLFTLLYPSLLDSCEQYGFELYLQVCHPAFPAIFQWHFVLLRILFALLSSAWGQ